MASEYQDKRFVGYNGYTQTFFIKVFSNNDDNNTITVKHTCRLSCDSNGRLILDSGEVAINNDAMEKRIFKKIIKIIKYLRAFYV